MKTIGELRQLILDNDGCLKIGKLFFEYQSGEDVDIKIGDHGLLAWIPKDQDDSKLLEDIEFSETSELNNMEGMKDAVRAAETDKIKYKKEVLEVEKRLEELSEKVKDVQYCNGKIEAYEKMLVGRTAAFGA